MMTLRKTICILALFVSCPTILFAEDAKEKAMTDANKGIFVGKVSVDKNDKGKAKSASLAADDGNTYQIELKSKGSSLAKDADGESVEVKGSVKRMRHGTELTLLLNVKSYNLIFTGKVTVEKKGKTIAKIKLGNYDVKLDAKSKEMAAKAEGKDVVATGSKSESKGKEESATVSIISYTIKGE